MFAQPQYTSVCNKCGLWTTRGVCPNCGSHTTPTTNKSIAQTPVRQSTCPNCGGLGSVRRRVGYGSYAPSVQPCLVCQGTGEQWFGWK
jgi:rRNA maturation protein Nop10